MTPSEQERSLSEIVLNSEECKSIGQKLEELDRVYRELENTKNTIALIALSTSAYLELCGWVDEVNDLTVLKLVEKFEIIENKNDSKIFKDFKEEIKKIHGISYKKHLMKLIALTLGVKGVDAVNKEKQNFGNLDTMLDEMHAKRSILAHQQCLDEQQRFDAPGKTLTKYQELKKSFEELLEYLETYAQKLK